jgi:hypothetical protein
MAGRVLDRRVLRAQADQAEREAAAPDSPVVGDGPAPASKGKAKTKAKAKGTAVPKVRKPRAKKAPPRLFARWGVFDAGMKQVAVFDYNQRAAAEEKVAQLLGKQKGTYFLQVVKEPMPEPAPAEVVSAG